MYNKRSPPKATGRHSLKSRSGLGQAAPAGIISAYFTRWNDRFFNIYSQFKVYPATMLTKIKSESEQILDDKGQIYYNLLKPHTQFPTLINF